MHAIWITYEEITFEIVGIGESTEQARREAAENAFLPGDFEVESWDEIDWSDGAVFSQLHWATATNADYVDAIREDQYAQLAKDGELRRSVIDELADAAGIWKGPVTRRKLAALAAEMRPRTGADYDRIIAEFQARKGHTEALEAAE